jgi:long-chain acyl-CoA synthetase
VPDILLMLSRSLDQAMSFPSLQVVVSGGSLLRLEDQLFIEGAFGVELLNGYGLTEFTPITGNIRGQSKKGTIGLPCDSLEVRIEEGEICLRTEDMASSYYRRAEETREAVQDGWFHTGDLGYYDGSHLVFAREKKETRKVHGNMVDLNEVRRAIALVDPALEVKVDCTEGSLFAQLGIPASVDFAQKVTEIRRGLKQSIAGHKIPRKFYRMDECPQGGSKTCP